MKRAVVAAVLLASILLAGYAQESRPLVLVFDLKTTHLSKDEMIILVDYIASNLLNSGQYRVIDRRQREQALSEIAFASSDLSEEQLRLKVGKFLAATYMLDGSIGSIGDRFLLNLKLVDVNTAETLKTASQRYVNVNELIDDSARLTLGMVGASVAGVTRPGGSTPPPARPPAVSSTASQPQAGPEPARSASSSQETLGPLMFAADGTVKDTRTGLTWAREFREDISYAEAESYVAGLRLGGNSDWRIPTEEEMVSLGQTLVQMSGQPHLPRVVELLGSEDRSTSARGETVNTFWTQTSWRRDPGRMIAIDMGFLLLGNNTIRGGIGRPNVASKDSRQEVRAVRR